MSKTRKVRTTKGPTEAVGISMAPPVRLQFGGHFGGGEGDWAQLGPSRAIGITYKSKAVAFRVNQ